MQIAFTKSEKIQILLTFGIFLTVLTILFCAFEAWTYHIAVFHIQPLTFTLIVLYLILWWLIVLAYITGGGLFSLSPKKNDLDTDYQMEALGWALFIAPIILILLGYYIFIFIFGPWVKSPNDRLEELEELVKKQVEKTASTENRIDQLSEKILTRLEELESKA
ncbi:hypothetical protein LCGC14_0196120 [marine sediment metagenome]|uniref:Uncharacterized protein n=1 Tax=marine sediment metagenome TaxID=412755 RepID=A0A0F9UQ61_9ZZZZ